MHTLRLITSSSQRLLAEALSDTMLKSPASPLERESIVVLSNGMARWLSMELAIRQGVSAGLDFRFPNDLLDDCFRALLPDAPVSSPFAPDAMSWRIASLLPGLATRPGFEQIAAYLGNGSDDRRLLQISRNLADTFDQYTIFRPEMVTGWDNGEGDGWQPLLWRALGEECRGRHRAALLREFSKAITSGNRSSGRLPRRISLFGISYLPPFHLEALRLLSSRCEVTCYLLNPCGLYWGNLISERDLAGLALRADLPPEAVEYYETGNPLLSSLGTLGQEFFETLLEYGFECEELDDPSAITARSAQSEQPTLLSAIQADILTLNDRPAGGTKAIVPADDRSLQIHSCHGPLREMEILYDNLLAMFDELPELEPRQIVVMIPDIESYAPYISAVFGSRSGGRPPLPYSIADRSVRRESPFADAFLSLLDFSSGRFGINEVLSILEIPSVATRFDISVDELAQVRTWLHQSGIRWGLDAEHRVELGFPEFEDYSWRSGLDRLFLGYALAPDGAGTFHGILPYPAIEGRQAIPLGKLAEFIDRLRRVHLGFAKRHTLQQWADLLSDTVGAMLEADDLDPGGPTSVAKAINSLREAQASFGFMQPLGLEAVRDCLKQRLTQGGCGYGFMGGGITFCAMLPMRSIPMRVVCLAGMNDGQFPRTSRQPGFSLMSGARRRGDRSLRDEDRYLFLEALMSAGERLCISYNGQSDRDNSIIPPSVLVAELMDYVENGFLSRDGAQSPRLLRRHRLQGFSSAYFEAATDSGLFSYDVESFKALEARRRPGRVQRVFINETLPAEPAFSGRIDAGQLRRFLLNPAAAFLEQRMKIFPFNPAEEPDEREPFAVEGLPGYSLSQELVSRVLRGAGREECYLAARSSGILPPLAAGKLAFDAAWNSSSLFAATVEPLLGETLERLTIDLTLDRFRITGTLDGINSGTHLRWRYAGIKGKDRLSIWLDHLLLNLLSPPGFPRESLMIASDISMRLSAVDNPAGILLDLLELYDEGMLRPLPFFPQTSWEFLTGGMGRAIKSWQGEERIGIPGESGDTAVGICFAGQEPLGEEFRLLAGRVYAPLQAAVKEEKLS
ncbi:MAG TPA: exodeoxyribonuclease V subunit gamma [Geobacter sp.]|nr:exodeoxyribonuclease V subunit gamma [Geobacter sp.]